MSTSGSAPSTITAASVRARRRIEVRVVLPGEADAAVELNVALGVEDLGTDRVGGGHRRGEPGAVQVVGASGVPCRGRGLLRVDQHVRRVVLDRLEGADGAAELLAHLGVLDGHLQGGPADADGLGGGEDAKHRARLDAPRRVAPGPRRRRRCAERPTRCCGWCPAASSAVTVTPSASASTTTTSSPATRTSTAASGAPSTAGLSPITTRSEPTTTLTGQPECADDGCRRPDPEVIGRERDSGRTAVDHHRGGRDGRQERPGHSSRPCASSTTANSDRPKPEPPCSSEIASPCQPSWAAADQMAVGRYPPESASSVARAAPRLFSRVSWPDSRVGEVAVLVGDG